MTQLIVGAASAAVGFAIGGPTGAQIGWAVGTALAAPTQKTQGPRLTDLKVTGAEYGQPIPWIEGHPRISGQVWWSSERREIATTTEVGKGGGVENTAYTYEVDQLIGLCDREITYVSRIWLNGKLVFTALSDAEDESLTASNTADAWNRMTVYTGNATQMPDATYEAAVGAGNAPAYRGRGSVFIEGLQLGSSGQIPNLTFEVVVDGALTFVSKGLLCQFDELDVDGNFKSTLGPNFVKNATNSLDLADFKFGPGSGVVGGAVELHTPSSPSIVMDTTGKSWRLEFWHRPSSEGGDIVLINGTKTIELQMGQAFFSSAFVATWDHGGGARGTNAQRPANNVWNHIAIQYRRTNPRELELFSAGEYINVFPGVAGDDNPFSGNGITRVRFNDADGKFDSVLLRYFDESEEGELYDTLGYTVPTEPFSPPPYAYTLVDPAEATLQATVEALCARAGMPAGTYDATALASITRPVRAMAISQVTAIRTVLEQLAGAYFFECYSTDKLYFVPRGGAVALTVPAADMGAGEDGPAAEQLSINVLSDEQIPAQVSLSYMNADADYNTATEHSDRLISSVTDTQTAALPLAFTATEAKGIADAMLADAYASRINGEVALTVEYTRLVPTDVVTLVAPDGTSYRARIVRRQDAGMVCSFEWVVDDTSAIQSAGITSTDYAPALTVALPSLTDLELLDIPLLRDADDSPGLYVVAKPFGSIWPGYQLLTSVDGGTEYSAVATGTSRAVFGVTTTALTTWAGGNVFDHASSVTVDVGSGTLSSATRDALLNTEANAMLVGSEVIQFLTATLVSAGVYTLTGLLRGRRGTEWAMSGHASGERCVLLRQAGMLRATYDAARIGLATFYKGVTLGKAVSTAAAQSITDTGVVLKPFAPVNLRATRSSSGNFTITWERRSRLSYRWPASSALPLGEEAESYQIEVFTDGTYTTSPRALTSSTPSVAYSAALQELDFGSLQSTLYLRVYQVSATVGRGTALQGSVTVEIDTPFVPDELNGSVALSYGDEFLLVAYGNSGAASRVGFYTFELGDAALGLQGSVTAPATPGGTQVGQLSAVNPSTGEWVLFFRPQALDPATRKLVRGRFGVLPPEVVNPGFDVSTTLIYGLTYADGKFIMLTRGGTVYHSTDGGATWSSAGSVSGTGAPAGPSSNTDVAAASFCELGGNLIIKFGNAVAYNAARDGLAWTAATGDIATLPTGTYTFSINLSAPAATGTRAVIVAQGLITFGGQPYSLLYSSTDGMAWTLDQTEAIAVPAYGVWAFGGNFYTSQRLPLPGTNDGDTIELYSWGADAITYPGRFANGVPGATAVAAVGTGITGFDAGVVYTTTDLLAGTAVPWPEA